MTEIIADVNKVPFLDLNYDPTPMDSVLSLISECGGDQQFSYIVTPNVDHVVRYHASKPELKSLYEDAWLCLCDSMILQLLAKIAGLNLPVVRGSDLTARMFDDVIKKDDRVCVIGGDDNVVEHLTAAIGADRLSHYNPPMGFVKIPEEIEKCVDFVLNHPSRYVFFAIGSPQQEIVAHAVWKTGNATGVGFCIGASIDFLTGKENRAPQWMQNTGLEWLFRLFQDPKRMWKRYLIHGTRIFWLYIVWLPRRTRGE